MAFLKRFLIIPSNNFFHVKDLPLVSRVDRMTAQQPTRTVIRLVVVDEQSLARIRNAEIGFVFQTFNLLNRTTALQTRGCSMPSTALSRTQH